MEEFYLKPAIGAVKKKKRKGRGNASGKGGESTRGHKGQKSRSGYSLKPGFEGGQTPLYRRLPKRNGFKPIKRIRPLIVNLNLIESKFKDKDIIDPQSLNAKGLIKGNNRKIKILGEGTLSRKVSIKAHFFSKKAQQKIEKVGATWESLK